MWINEYINGVTCFLGVMSVFAILLNGVLSMAYGDYFITLKSPFLNGLTNFSILCVILAVIAFFIYLLSYPFYDSELNDFTVYFFSIVFFLVTFLLILVLLYVFFRWVGGGA